MARSTGIANRGRRIVWLFGVCTALGLAAVATAGDGVWGPSNGPSPGDVGRHGYVTSLALHPTKPTTVYAAVRSMGVFSSTDAGRRWRAMNTGLPKTSTGPYSVRVLALDPGTPTTLYGGGISSGAPGVFKTTDGGRHWRTFGAAAVGGVYALAIDPKNPLTVFAAGYKGVRKSTNGGRTWRAANAGLPNRTMTALAIDPLRPRTVYVAADGLVFKSTNGGREWLRAGNGLVENALVETTALAIDSRRPQTVYVAGYHGVVDTVDSGGVSKSTDGGRTWRAVNVGLPEQHGTPSAYALAIDPRAPDVVYVAADSGDLFATDGGVFRSVDAGETWIRFNRGLRPKDALQVRALAIDATSRLLYAGTGFGVFDYRSRG